MPNVLTISGLTVSSQKAPVVEDLSLSVGEGQTLALVGESGCGKTMTSLAIMGLLPHGFRLSAGSVFLDDLKISDLSDAEMRKVRGNRLAMIFQEPMTALNPVYTIGEQIAEVLRLHQGLDRARARERVVEMLGEVGLPEPASRIDAYPHQFSGGMRQRVMIVMALACQPRLLIADEPTTALDVTVQGQIFDLLKEMQRRTGTAILLITHNLLAAADLADEVAVLYAGRCLEKGRTDQVLGNPLHPYTIGLLSSQPFLRLGQTARESVGTLSEIPGLVPAMDADRDFCCFSPRCSRAGEKCRQSVPPLADQGQGRLGACFNLKENYREITAVA